MVINGILSCFLLHHDLIHSASATATNKKKMLHRSLVGGEALNRVTALEAGHAPPSMTVRSHSPVPISLIYCTYDPILITYSVPRNILFLVSTEKLCSMPWSTLVIGSLKHVRESKDVCKLGAFAVLLSDSDIGELHFSCGLYA